MVAFYKKAARVLEPVSSGFVHGSPDVGSSFRQRPKTPHEGDSMTETNNAATLLHAGGELKLPRIQVVEGNEGYDVSKLLKQTGAVTFDPGFMNTAATTSAITYIDGDAGILRYRGYPIEQLAQHSSFLEVSYLLIYGNLPTPTELESFDQRIRHHTLLHEELKGFFSGFPRDAHPMPVLSSAVSALSTFYQDSLDPFNAEQVEVSTYRLLAKMPVIAAYALKKSVGQPMLYPDNSHNLVENFLRLSLGRHQRPVRPGPRRRQRGRAQDAPPDPGRRHQARGLHGEGQEQGRRRPPDGLRAPGLQELRPARQNRQGHGPRDPQQARRKRRTAGHRAPAGREGAAG